MEQNLQSRSLVKATIISAVIAIIALVLFILPAEYNIDPTGIGKKLGLTVFNNQAVIVQTQKPETSSSEVMQDSVVVTVPARRGIEYKLAMKQYQKVSYEWSTNEGQLYVDLHGEPKGDTTGYFESYTIATVDKMKGSFTAPFEGSHGWYWKNKSDKAIDVQLTFSGQYTIEGIK
ncbi:MAG: hypothetical protein MJK12_01745 [Colwellia sp.]|nr:hypothetical protein [Colwellia sp.]